MYCYLLEFPVMEGREEGFIAAWAALTEHIRRESGGLGSRMHRTPDGKFIAYAQWPDPDERNREKEETAEGRRLRKAMSENLASAPVRILYEFEVVKDLLAKDSTQQAAGGDAQR